MITPLYWIRAQRYARHFPDPDEALCSPDGLLAAGGDLGTPRVLEAYRSGIFPWYEQGQPILWWSPDPRCVLYPEALRVSRNLGRVVKRQVFEVAIDHDLPAVIRDCSAPRSADGATWLTGEMIDAYIRLGREGYAHSVEARNRGQLVGGLYGIAIGRVFFGESMFSRMNNASKVCLVVLARRLHEWGYRLIDCQVRSAHLESLGAVAVARSEFVIAVREWAGQPPAVEAWGDALSGPSSAPGAG
ncbi:MAG: leucyl/phenylalanyl-tRNA--protein transferase [Gammaproteobacteria bacterium]